MRRCIFLTFLLLCGRDSTIAQENDGRDAADTVLAEYRAELAQLGADRPTSEMEKFHSRWLSEFLTVADQIQNKPASLHLLRKALGMANSLGRHEISEQICIKLLDRTTDPMDRISLLQETGSIYSYLARSTGDAAHFETSKDYHNKAVILAGKSLASVPARKRKAMAAKMVNSMAAAASVEAQDSATRDTAIDKYRDARSLVRQYSINSHPGIIAGGVTLEGLGYIELDMALDALDTDRSKKILSELMSLPDTRRNPSEYLVIAAGRLFGRNTNQFEEFLLDWKMKVRSASSRALIDFELAESYFHRKSFSHAVPIYEQLLSDQLPDLLELDVRIDAKQGEGHYGSSILNLGLSELELGNLARAKAAFEKFLKLFPQDRQAAFVRTQLAALKNVPVALADGSVPIVHQQGTNFSVLLAINVTVVVLVVIFAWLRKSPQAKQS